MFKTADVAPTGIGLPAPARVRSSCSPAPIGLAMGAPTGPFGAPRVSRTRTGVIGTNASAVVIGAAAAGRGGRAGDEPPAPADTTVTPATSAPHTAAAPKSARRLRGWDVASADALDPLVVG